MKNNKKIILVAGAAALGLVAATGATSGFAWFTTNRTVNAAFNTVNVGSNAASLVISNNANLSSTGEGNQAGNSITGVTPVATHDVTDVSSGDGLTFKVPTKDASGTLIGESTVPAETGLVSTGLYAYVDYNFWVGQVTATANTLDVYLSTITITINNTGTNLGGAARAALFVGTVAEANRKLIVNSADEDNQTYLSWEAEGHAATNTSIVAASTLLAAQVDTQAEAAGLPARKMFETVGGTPTALTLRVWFEGTNFQDQEFPATAPTVTTSIYFVAFDHQA